MHLKKSFLLICSVILAGLLAGCGDATSTVNVRITTNAAPTTTIYPTTTPAPTIAPTPTPPPPPTPTLTPVPTLVPITPSLTQSITASGLVMNLVVTPGKEGINTFYVQILENEKIPTDIVLVRLNFVQMDMDMGKQMLDLRPDEPTMPGVYEGKAQVITMVGRWKIDVLVRRQGKADVTSFFQLNFNN